MTEDTNAKEGRSRWDFHPELTPAQFEAEFWSRVLERNPDYQDVLRRLAESLARQDRHAELLPLDRHLAELRPTDPIVHYHLACTLARLDDVSGALAMLRQAIRLGYDDFGHIETDPDLDVLRDLPEFSKLLKQRRSRR
jgi:tetratricopeptide (TPR) repeat protein